MLSKCANPECRTQFQYLREGKLYQIETDGAETSQPAGPQLISGKKRVHRVEYFWLCGPCSEILTLGYQSGKGVITVPRDKMAPRRAAAS